LKGQRAYRQIWAQQTTTNQQKEPRKQNSRQQRKHNWSNIIIVPDAELEEKDNPMKK